MKTRYNAAITFDCKKSHPDSPGTKGLKYSDTYTIDPDYFNGPEHISDYITEDLMLVAGGGYDTNTIENYTITITKEL